MHFAVIGTGRMGSFRARTLRGLPDVTELTLYRQDRARATALAAELEATVAGSVEEAIGARPDALVISTSTPDHAALVEAGVNAGLPVFCEKPISMDLEATDRLAKLVAASGVPVQVGFQRRFDAGFRRARELVRSGALGRVYLVRVLAHDYEPPPESFIAVSGGMYKDMLIHEFDLIPWVAGQPIVEVYAEGSVLVDESFDRQDDVDTAAAVLRLSEGALAVVTASRHDPLGYDARMELHGSGDSVAIGWDERAPLRPVESDKAAGGPYHTSFFDRFGDAYRAEMAYFLRVARGEVESPSTVEESRQSLRVAVAADLSRREHRPVAVSSVS